MKAVVLCLAAHQYVFLYFTCLPRPLHTNGLFPASRPGIYSPSEMMQRRILEKCFNYPCPYDPSALEQKGPKHRVSKIIAIEQWSGKPERYENTSSYPHNSAPVNNHPNSRKPPPLHYCRDPSKCITCRAYRFKAKLTDWLLSQRKPYTAITVQIDRLTSEQYEEDDIGGIIDLVDVIRIQDSGPTEAARAIRKKL